MKKLATLISVLALAAPGVAFAGGPPSVPEGGGGGGGYPALGSECGGWALGYCFNAVNGKIEPCRCAKVLVCGVWTWQWVIATTPPA